MGNEIEISELPPVKITENGKPVDTSSIDNYDQFMSMLMQASQAATARKMLKIEQDRVSKGKVYPIDSQYVTPLPKRIAGPEPAQSVYIDNTGGQDLSFTINDLADAPIPVPSGREHISRFLNHVIECIYIWTPPGTNTTARILLSY